MYHVIQSVINDRMRYDLPLQHTIPIVKFYANTKVLINIDKYLTKHRHVV